MQAGRRGGQSLLRTTLYVIDALLIAAALICAATGVVGAAVATGFWAVLLFIGLAVERWRYKRIADRAPGPGWQATDECFADPETGRIVTVYFNPVTGERRYVLSR